MATIYTLLYYVILICGLSKSMLKLLSKVLVKKTNLRDEYLTQQVA